MFNRTPFLLDTDMAKGENVEQAAATGRARVKPAAGAAAVLVRRAAATGPLGTRVEAVLSAAERSGLIADKDGRIGGRVSRKLVREAKARTGIEADTDLIEFALANLALEDNFAGAFKAARATVDPDLDLGF